VVLGVELMGVLDELFGEEELGECVVFVPGPALASYAQENWTPAVKRPSVVYMRRVMIPFEVQTNEGTLRAQPGDVVAHDPVSGHFWPVAASYVEQHYELLPGETNMGDAYSG